MKDYLKKLIESKSKKINEIRSKIQASQDVNEVRSLTAEAEELQTEIKEAEAKLNEIEAEEARSAVPAEAKLVNPMVKGSFKAEEKRDAENVLESMEYRNAFKAYVQNGTKLPSEIRGQVISTDETGAAIPLTIMNEVINTVRKRYGNLYNKVRKMNVKGGVDFPIGALQASFKWINESTVSPRQKTDKLGKSAITQLKSELLSHLFLQS